MKIVEIPIRTFTLNISANMSVIQKKTLEVNCVITKEERYYQDNQPISKDDYLA